MTHLTRTKLTDLCDLISVQVDPQDFPDATYIGLEHCASGRFTATGRGKARDVQSHKFSFKRGDVLYGKLRPYLDKAILADTDGVCTTELLVLRPKNEVTGEFIVGVVHSPAFIEHAMSGVTGVQHPRTSWHRIAEFEIPTFSKAERDVATAILWRTHDAIASCEIVERQVQALKSTAMRELFSQGLHREVQKDTQVGPIPQSWDAVRIGSLGKVGNGSTPKRTIPEYWNGGHFPWLTSAKVYDRDIEAASEFVTDRALAECHLPRVQPGAVLMAITGQGKTLGHCAVLNIEASVSQHVAYMALDPQRADPRFIRGYLETQYDSLRQVASGGGSTKGALTCAYLRDLPVPVPSRLEHQREIVAILDAIDRKIALHTEKRMVLEALFKSLLHKLMTGEVHIADITLDALVARKPEAA